MDARDDEPVIIGISETAKRQLSETLDGPSILAVIERYIAEWEPRAERGGDGVIKWCEAISLHCNANIYRLKSIEYMGNWRVFFFMLDLDEPPARHVEEIVEWQGSNERFYNDMIQPHVKRLLRAVTQYKNAGRLRLMR